MDIVDYIKPSLLQKQKRRDKRLHEEVIEVGRYRGGKKDKILREKGYKKFYETNFVDSFPKNIRIAPLGEMTYFDDKLGCLKKFLMSNVGKRWDDVFSKLNSVLDVRSLQGMHIVGHIWDFVERDVEMVDGKVVQKRHHFYWKDNCSNWWQYKFYIHPETGLLCRWCPPKKVACPKKARYKKEKEKLKWQMRREQKTDKTPPKVVESPLNTEGERKQKSVRFYSADFDDDFKKVLEQELLEQYILEDNQKPKTSEERFRLLFYSKLKPQPIRQSINPIWY